MRARASFWYGFMIVNRVTTMPTAPLTIISARCQSRASGREKHHHNHRDERQHRPRVGYLRSTPAAPSPAPAERQARRFY
jgi:hypothetical protein